jgi:hypothetical protein
MLGEPLLMAYPEAVFLSLLLGKKENTVRQQLKEWYKEPEKKKGQKRDELDVTTCFAPLLARTLGEVGEDGSSKIPLAVRGEFTQIKINTLP